MLDIYWLLYLLLYTYLYILLKLNGVVVVNDELDTRTKLNGLREGGIMVAEITFRTAYAEKGIRLALEDILSKC